MLASANPDTIEKNKHSAAMEVSNGDFTVFSSWLMKLTLRLSEPSKDTDQSNEMFRSQSGLCPNLECADPSALWSLRPVAASCRKRPITKHCGAGSRRTKAVTGHRTPNWVAGADKKGGEMIPAFLFS